MMSDHVDSASPLDITVRARFEKWISSPPFELPIHRNGANSAWPGDYGHYETQLAWCAWEDATPKWKPIETAPKDGTFVLCAGEFDRPGDWRIKMGYWDACDGDWYLFGASWNPTHWMPLPEAPNSKYTTNEQ